MVTVRETNDNTGFITFSTYFKRTFNNVLTIICVYIYICNKIYLDFCICILSGSICISSCQNVFIIGSDTLG